MFPILERKFLTLPTVLLAGLALAACETTGSGSGGPTAAATQTPPAGRQMTDVERQQMDQVLQVALPQIEQCIAPFANTARERGINEVDFILEFHEDGRPRGMGIDDPDRIDTDPNYRAAIQALFEGMSNCPPLQGMPAGTYPMWEYLPINYTATPV